MILDSLTIVGVGLIGGSIGLAAKRRGLARHVLGAGRNPTSLERAKALGTIDEIFLDYRQAVARAELAVFCTPVDGIVEQVLQAASACTNGTLLTDAGSTKAAIVAGIEGRLPPGVAFVGSHPLAGSEKRGPEHAAADLFQDRVTIVTPTPHTPVDAVEKIITFWQALGCRVRILDPVSHDQALALTSHLPHLAAAALAGLLPAELAPLTATGFRDTTRVAAGDPSLWTAIFTQNRRPVLEAVAHFGEQLEQFRRALEAEDSAALLALLTQAKQVRDALGS